MDQKSYCVSLRFLYIIINEMWTEDDRPLSPCSRLEFLPLISMLPNRGWMNKIVGFLIAKCLSAFIIVIRYKEHDQDGGSTIKVYKEILTCLYSSQECVGFN